MPEIFDAEDDRVDITFDYAALNNFLKYDASTNKIVPNRSSGVNFDFVPVGTTVLSITLTDDNPIGSLSSFYSILVRVAAMPVNPGPGPGPGPNPKPPCEGDDCEEPPVTPVVR